MTLSRYYAPSTRIEHAELEGLIRVIDETLDEGDVTPTERASYVGCRIALNIFLRHERVEYPIDFLKLFQLYLSQDKE